MKQTASASRRRQFRPKPLARLALIAAGLCCAAEPGLAKQQQKPSPAPREAVQKAAPPSAESAPKSGKTEMTLRVFLDRLMMAESNGRDTARNPRSTALGPYQFIELTFVEIARRHFSDEVAKLDRAQLLKLRTKRSFARRAAEALTRENAAHLAAAGIRPTFTHLRLAYLLGAGDAVKVLRAKPKKRLTKLLSGSVIKANPFMVRLTARGLVARAARDIHAVPSSGVGLKSPLQPARSADHARPRIKIRCNLARASCRRWVALRRKRQR